MAKRKDLSKPEPIRKEGGSQGGFTMEPVPGNGAIVNDAEPPFGNSARRYADTAAGLIGRSGAPGPRRGTI
jgi:hypothetical protein